MDAGGAVGAVKNADFHLPVGAVKRLLAQQFEIRAGQSLFWFRPWSRREGGILRIIVGIRPTEGRFPAIVHPVVGQVGVEGFQGGNFIVKIAVDNGLLAEDAHGQPFQFSAS